MEDMIQTQNSITRPSSRFDSIMSDLINENEESLSCQSLTNPYIPNSTDWIQESCRFGNLVSISSYQPELHKHQPLDLLVSYPFPEIKLELESDPEPHVGDSISLFDSIMILVSLPDFFTIPELTLNHVLVHCEIGSPISYDHTSMMEKVCEHQFFGLEPIFEPITTLTCRLSKNH